MDMDLIQFYSQMQSGELVTEEMLKIFNKLSQEALKITMEINNKYHTPEEIVDLFSKLTAKEVDKSFRLFSPFYTKNHSR